MKLHEIGGAKVVESASGWLLVGAPDGISTAWRAAGLPAVGPDVVLLGEGSGRDVAGLYGLLSLLGGVVRSAPACLLHSLTAEGPGAIAVAWVQTEAGVLAVSLDGQLAGMAEEIGPFVIEALDAGSGRLAWAVTEAGERWVFVGSVRDPRRCASLERGADRVVR